MRTHGDSGGTCSKPLCDKNGNLVVDDTTLELGPIRIPKNLRVEDKGRLIITGTIHVEGKVFFEDDCQVELHPDYETQSGVIIVEEDVTIKNHCVLSGSGDPASHLVVISAKPAVKNSLYVVFLKNLATAVVLYAVDGGIDISGVGEEVRIKAVYGEAVRIRNKAQLVYEGGLTSVEIIPGPRSKLELRHWREVQ